MARWRTQSAAHQGSHERPVSRVFAEQPINVLGQPRGPALRDDLKGSLRIRYYEPAQRLQFAQSACRQCGDAGGLRVLRGNGSADLGRFAEVFISGDCCFGDFAPLVFRRAAKELEAGCFVGLVEDGLQLLGRRLWA